MEERGENNAFAVLESFSDWWELAGLGSAVGDTPINWLAESTSAPAAPAGAALPAAKKETERPPVPAIAWPNDIATLRKMVADGAPLPGNEFGPIHFPPIGAEACDVMIISDLPDIFETGTTIQSAAILLRRMMLAIGINLSDCYMTSLATTMPSTGEVPEDTLPNLAGYMRHQIEIVRPKSVMILGSTACNALLADELMNARSQLRNINHKSLNIAAMATFHPRTLIARPSLKAQAWKDLRMFARRASECV